MEGAWETSIGATISSQGTRYQDQVSQENPDNWYFMGLFQTGKNVDETQTMFEYLWEKKGVEGRMPTSTRSRLHAGSLGVDGVESTPLSSRQEMSVCTVDWLERVEEGDESTLAVVVGSLYTCELEFGTKGTL